MWRRERTCRPAPNRHLSSKDYGRLWLVGSDIPVRAPPFVTSQNCVGQSSPPVILAAHAVREYFVLLECPKRSPSLSSRSTKKPISRARWRVFAGHTRLLSLTRAPRTAPATSQVNMAPV